MTTQRLPHQIMTFFRSGPMPCPYLSGRVEQQLFAELSGAKALDAFDVLSQGGFRRSHHIIYKPACAGCNACVPVRIPVARFKAGKPQMGFLNPFLYQHPEAFNDVTHGTNAIPRGPGTLAYGFAAAIGWDGMASATRTMDIRRSPADTAPFESLRVQLLLDWALHTMASYWRLRLQPLDHS